MFRRDLQTFLGAPFFDDCARLADGATPSFAGTPVEGACLFDLRTPAELCNPINKSAVVPPRETVAVIDESNASSHGSLLCYKVSTARRVTSAQAAALAGLPIGSALQPMQARHLPRKQLHSAPGNQFPGPIIVDTVRPSVACIPTEVIGIAVDP